MRQRGTGAVSGALWSIAPILMILGVGVALTPAILAPRIGNWALHDADRTIYFFRTYLTIWHLVIVFLLAVHWFAAAMFGRGDIIRIRSANALFIVAYLIILLSLLTGIARLGVGNFELVPPAFDRLCDVLAISKDSQFGFRSFRDDACAKTFEQTVLVMGCLFPFVALVLSAALRIILSRRREKVRLPASEALGRW